MGKRKKSSRKPQGPKKREPLSTTFQCLFCNHENSVTVKLDKKIGMGHLSCKVCGQSFDSNINYLSAAVDVYSDWVDACDAVAKGGSGAATGDRDTEALTRGPAAAGQRAAGGGDRYEGDDFVVDDEPEAEDDFGDDDDDD